MSEIASTGNVIVDMLQHLEQLFISSMNTRHANRAITATLPPKDNEGASKTEESPVPTPQDVFSSEIEMALRSTLHVLLIGMGDLNRYEMACHGTTDEWDEALLFYRRAARVAPFEGSVCRPLASAARFKGDVFEAGYYLATSAITARPYPPAREAMLELFEAQRIEADQFENVTALSRLSVDQHIGRFKCHFLAAAGIAYSRTGADRFQFHLDKSRRHLSTLLQLLSVAAIRDSGSGLGSKGDYRLFNHPTGSAQSSGGSDRRQQLRLSHSIDGLVSQAVMIGLSLLASVAAKNDMVGVCSAIDWNSAYGGADPSGLSLDDRLLLEKRYGAQSLHKVQVIPGLIDLGRLVLGAVSACVSSEGTGVGGTTAASVSTQDAQAITRIAATTRPVGLFFDFLKANPEFCVLAVLDKQSWEQLEADLPAYATALTPLMATSRGKTTGDAKYPSQCMLQEDFDTAGLLPFQSTFECRYNASMEASETYEMFAADEDSVTRQALDYFDSMWLTVCATRSSAILRELCASRVHLGNSETGIYFDRNRQVMLPVHRSALTDEANRLPIIVYREASAGRYAGLTSSGLQTAGKRLHILSEEEFMRGSIPSVPLVDHVEAEEDGCDGTKEEESDAEGGAGDEGSAAEARDSDISDLSDNDEGAGLPVEDIVDADPSDLPSGEAGQETEESVARQMLAARCAALLQKKPVKAPEPILSAAPAPENADTSVPSSETGKGAEGAGTAVSGKGMLRVTDMTVISQSKSQTTKPNDMVPRKPRGPPAIPVGNYGRLSAKANGELPLIVIDAPNVAMRHGINAKFSCRGIKLAIDFFHAAGHRVVSFLPVREFW